MIFMTNSVGLTHCLNKALRGETLYYVAFIDYSNYSSSILCYDKYFCMEITTKKNKEK